MSSSQTSLSNTNSPEHGHRHGHAHGAGHGQDGHGHGGNVQPFKVMAPAFPGLMDVILPVSIRLGTGAISVGAILGLKSHSIIRLAQSVGQDLDIIVNGETIARGEVAIVDDSTSIRLTDIAVPQSDEVDL